MLDRSVYCVDLLCRIAEHNPEMSFLLIGKGRYFEYHEKPRNITWVNSYLNHEQILHYINRSKCALMLTRRDTQGVMACELATYGIPLVTSGLPICHEIFDGFNNVSFVSNYEIDSIDFRQCVFSLSQGKNTKYMESQTMNKELELINKELN